MVTSTTDRSDITGVVGPLECERCHHMFQTRRQRIEHEQKGRRGDRVLCPCGDVCFPGLDENGDTRED